MSFMHGRLADEHAGRIVFLQDGVQLIDLIIHLVACDLVLGVDEQQLPFVALENLSGQNPAGSPPARRRRRTALQAEHVFHAVHLLHIGDHADAPASTAGIASTSSMCVEAISNSSEQLGVCDNVLHVLRQALAHVVVHFVVRLVIAVSRTRRSQYHEQHQEHREHLRHALGASHAIFGRMER